MVRNTLISYDKEKLTICILIDLKGDQEMRKELLKGLTEEQIEKASQCKNSAELLALAKEEGVELNEEQLDAVSGGACEPLPASVSRTCPICSTNTNGEYVETTPGDHKYHFICPSCGYSWDEK